MVSYILALGMGQRGHDVEVFSGWPLHEARTVQHESVTVHLFPANFELNQTSISSRLLRSRPAIAPDIVHAHDGSPPGLIAGWRCSKYVRRPLVTTFHCDLFLQHRSPLEAVLLRSFALLEQRILRDSKLVIALTESAKQTSKALRPWQAKTKVVPNGVTLSLRGANDPKDSAKAELGFPSTTTLCLYVGAVNFRKGIDVLLNAAALLEPSSSVQFLIAGKAAGYSSSVESTVRKLGLNNRVRLDGFIEESAMLTYIRAADVMVIPSRLEGFPLTLLEAFAQGLPVVASDIPPHREIIRDKWNGVLFKSENPMDLAEKVESALSDPQLRERLSTQSMNTAKQFTWTRVLDETEAIYQQAAG